MSNQLVTASCAAILAVYAAGYWRTREDARRLDDHSQARRPARPARPPASTVEPPEAGGASVAADPGGVRAQSAGPAASRKAPMAVRVPAEPARAVEADGQPVAAIVPDPVEAEPPPASQPQSADAVAASPSPEISGSPWHDGTYTGWGLSRHGDIEARVTIRNGGIVAVGIATCATRYPCYVIDEILQQPLFRQSADVDRVSRATESSDAYSDAVWEALQKAEAGPAAPEAAS